MVKRTPPQVIAANTILAIQTLLDWGDIRGACKLFNGIDDDDVHDIVATAYPSMINYDSLGQWVGPVRNENGWTP